ncbi:MAG TPA: calcium-binding protein, partial [Rhodocyclaceae bacterium]|nr:calcium-binding protein [Rhodocyclaceae bacterium]
MATIDGTLLDDVLYDLPGLDKISGLAGNDLIIVEAGADHGVGETVDGGAGYDRLWFASGAGGDSLVLQATVTGIEEVQIGDAVGNTDGTLALDVDASRVTTGLVLIGNAGDNAITGTARDDEIRGNGGADTLLGGAGNDDIFVRVDAPETANAGLQAEGNTLTLIGTAAGAVAVDLTAGDQIVSLGGVADAAVQQGFSHVDASSMAGAAIAVKGSALKNLIVATALADTLEGGGAGDLIVAGAGDDILIAGAAADAVGDTVLGGDGDDVLRFTAASGPQTLVLGANMTGVETVEVADAAGDRSGTAALSVNATGVKSALMLRGNDGDNSLTGTALADTLSGGGGTDVLAGGAGNDLYLFALGADATATERISDAVGKSDTVAFQSVVASDTLVLGSGVSGIERVRIDSAGTALNVDASAVRNGLEMA